LAQLALVARILNVRDDSHWVTFDSPQSRSLLEGRAVTYIGYVPPRGFAQAAVALPSFSTLVRDKRPEAVLSTGAGVAAPALAAAVLRRVPAYYLESVSRFDGPSLTGKVMARTPGVRCFTQHAQWADSKWQRDISLLTTLQKAKEREAVSTGTSPEKTRVFVTLGTIRPYRFDMLVDQLSHVLPESADVTWQLGCTSRDDLPGVARDFFTPQEFDRLATEADIVITHAGVGTALRLLDLGVRPVVVPRRAHRREHVDDHQVQAARELGASGLVDVYEADRLSADALSLGSAPGLDLS